MRPHGKAWRACSWLPQGDFTVTDNYSLNQYGEIGLAAGKAPLVQPTAVASYGSAEYAAVVADNALRGIKLDDGASTNFLKDATTKAQQLPYLTTSDPVRVGSPPAQFRTDVILGYGNNSWKFQPLSALTAANAESVQPASFTATRPEGPADVGGQPQAGFLQRTELLPPPQATSSPAASFTPTETATPITVKEGCNARGAANAENFERQQSKIVAAITKSGADVVSLEEIENSAQFGKNRDDALSKLVDALNVKTPPESGTMCAHLPTLPPRSATRT